MCIFFCNNVYSRYVYKCIEYICTLAVVLQVYSVGEERKQDQVEVDKQLLAVVRQHPERKFMYSYLTSLFSLKSKEYPHKMVF